MQRYYSSQVTQPQIKIIRNNIVSDLDVLSQTLPPTVNPPECSYPDEYIKEETKLVHAKRLNIKYSSHKLNANATLIRKKHLFDAQVLIRNSKKKGAKIVLQVLNSAKTNAIKKGLQEERLFVKEVVIGRRLGQKKIDIKARGKMGMIHPSISSIKITLEEKSVKDFYKLIVTGKCPPGVGYIFKKILYQSDADFDLVRKFSYLTTSRGRYYRKVQFERLVQLVQKEYQKEGVNMKKDKIVRNLLEKAAEEFISSKKTQVTSDVVVAKSARQIHFDKNYQKK